MSLLIMIYLLNQVHLAIWGAIADPRFRPGFLVGYSNTLGLVGGLCSVDYGFALMFLSVIVVARDGNWTPSNGGMFFSCH